MKTMVKYILIIIALQFAANLAHDGLLGAAGQTANINTNYDYRGK